MQPEKGGRAMHPEEIPYEWDQKQKIVDKLDDLSDRAYGADPGRHEAGI